MNQNRNYAAADLLTPEGLAKYRLLVDHCPDFIWSIDADCIFLELSLSWLKMTGYESGSLIGTSCMGIVHPDDIAACRGFIQEIIDTGETIQSPEYRIRYADGLRRWHISTATPVTGPGGEFISVIGVSRDIMKGMNRRQQDIIDSLPDATFVIDNDRRIIAWNKAIERMTGVKEADMIGKSDFEYAIPFYGMRKPILIDLLFNDDDDLRENYNVISYEDGVIIAETCVPINLTKKKFSAWGKATLLYNASGKIVGAIESIRDVSLFKKIENELRESEEKFRLLFEQSASAQFLIKNRVCIDFNRTAVELLGYDSVYEISGLKPHELSPHGQTDGMLSSDKFDQNINHTLVNGTMKFEWIFNKKNNDKIYTDVILTAIPLKGEIILHGLLKDVTDQKKAEMALLISEQKYRTIFESSGTSMIIINRLGAIQLANETFISLMGLKKSDIEGKMYIEDFIDPENLNQFHDIICKKLHMNKISQTVELCVRNSMAEKRDIIAYIADIAQTDMLIISLIDVTETKRLEKDILKISMLEQQKIGRSLHDDLGQLLVGTGILCESLIKKMARLSFPEMDKIEKIYELIQNAKEHTRALARGLFPVDIYSGGLVIAVSRLVKDYEEIFNVSCHFLYDSYVESDNIVEVQLYYIIQESIINAIQHGKAENITIELLNEDNKLQLFIRDDGTGIIPDVEKTRSMGIRIMKYRAKTIGAVLNISNADGGGTVISCIK